MKCLRLFLLLSTVAIYLLTIIAVKNYGFNWPAVALNDILSLNWRAQFDIDFIVYLVIFAIWVVWREGGATKAYLLGALSIFLGGMFGFPYIIYASYIARGNPKALLLGVHSKD